MQQCKGEKKILPGHEKMFVSDFAVVTNIIKEGMVDHHYKTKGAVQQLRNALTPPPPPPS